MNWQVDGLRLNHPKHGAFLIRVFADGTACATRCPHKAEGVDVIVPSTKTGMSVDDVKAACERRIAELDGLA